MRLLVSLSAGAALVVLYGSAVRDTAGGAWQKRWKNQGLVRAPQTYRWTVGRCNHRSSDFGRKATIKRDFLPCLPRLLVVERCQAWTLFICRCFWSIPAGCILSSIGPNGHVSSTSMLVYRNGRGCWRVGRMLRFSIWALRKSPTATIVPEWCRQCEVTSFLCRFQYTYQIIVDGFAAVHWRSEPHLDNGADWLPNHGGGDDCY